MKVNVPDYDGDSPGGIVEREVPDEPIQKFLNWLLTANRYAYENNPEIAVEKTTRLRRDLTAASRKAPVKGSGTAEITVAGLLALCDVESTDELLTLVIAAREAAGVGDTGGA